MKRLKSSTFLLMAILLAIMVTTTTAATNQSSNEENSKVEAITGGSGGVPDIVLNVNAENGLVDNISANITVEGKTDIVGTAPPVNENQQVANVVNSNAAKTNLKVTANLNIKAELETGGSENANGTLTGRFTAAPTQTMNVDMAAYFNIAATNMTALYGFTDAKGTIEAITDDNSLVLQNRGRTTLSNTFFDAQNVTQMALLQLTGGSTSPPTTIANVDGDLLGMKNLTQNGEFSGAAPTTNLNVEAAGFAVHNISDNNVNVTALNNYFC